jgi:hypothetical protein
LAGVSLEFECQNQEMVGVALEAQKSTAHLEEQFCSLQHWDSTCFDDPGFHKSIGATRDVKVYCGMW